MTQQGELFGAVDLGQDQFVVVAARRAGSSYEVAGLGVAGARGYTEAMITDINEASKALEGAMRQAEVMAGAKLSRNVVAGIAGEHVHTESKTVHVKIQGGAVSHGDIDLAMDTLQAFPVTQNMEILHVLEQQFGIDGNSGIRQPLGMTGGLLEAEALVVTANANAMANLRSCLANAGMPSRRLMSSALASGLAVTTADERDLGVATIDWGGGSCNIALFAGGAPRLLRTRLLGGAMVDRDIAKVFRIPKGSAERIKREIGSAIQVEVDEAAAVQVPDAAGNEGASIEPHVLSMAIEPRVDEMLEQIKQELEGWAQAERLPAGVILAGGMANLRGIAEISHDALNMPVRLGRSGYSGPHAEEVAAPEFAAAMGLLELWNDHGMQQHEPASPAGGLAGWLKSLFGGGKPADGE